MDTVERRGELVKTLCRRRYERVENLAADFGVSERTIRLDIEALSRTVPIYTQSGRYGGGVYVAEGFTMDRMYMTDRELRVLHKLAESPDGRRTVAPTSEDRAVLDAIITQYTRPQKPKRKGRKQ